MAMRPIPLEIDMLSNLVRALRRARRARQGAPRMFVPPELVDRTALAELLVKERRGYLATELDVIQRHKTDLTARRARILAECPYERDLRTGEQLPVAPDLGQLERQLQELDRQHSQLEAKLVAASSRAERMVENVHQLLRAFDVQPSGREVAAPTTEAPAPQSFRLLTRGWSLRSDPEDRRLLRRLALMLPDGDDW